MDSSQLPDSGYITFFPKQHSTRYAFHIIPLPLHKSFDSLDLNNYKEINFYEFLTFCANLPDDFTAHSTSKQPTSKLGIISSPLDDFCKYKINLFNETVIISLIDKSLNPNYWTKFIDPYLDSKGFNSYFLKTQISVDEILKRFNSAECNYPAEHPYRKVGHYIFHNTNDVILKFQLQNTTYSITSQKRFSGGDTNNIPLDFFNNLEGYTSINYTDNIFFPMKAIDNQGNILPIHSLIYISPLYKDIIQRSNCIELDTSFFAMRPYVYCVPYGIINNESIAIGLSVGPTETKQLYMQFYELIKDSDSETFDILKTKPIISDEGVALIAFANDLSLEQFFCFKHLINKFGPNSQIAAIVRSLLFKQSREEFDIFWERNLSSITEIYLRSNDKQKKQFEKLFLTEFDTETSSFSCPQFDSQALWTRGPKRIPTCSNHSEANHMHINEKIGKTILFSKRIKKILEYLQKKEKKFLTRPNLQRLLQNIKKKRNYILNYKDLSNDHCQCRIDFFKNNLYNTQLPCVHNIVDYHLDKFEELSKINFDSHFFINKNVPHDILYGWSFPNTLKLPDFLIPQNGLKLLDASGYPDASFYEDVISLLPINIIEKSKVIIHGYIQNLFIYFCAEVYGEYKYDQEIYESFSSFTLHFIQGKNLINEYKSKIDPVQKQEAINKLLKINFDLVITEKEEGDEEEWGEEGGEEEEGGGKEEEGGK